MQDKPTHRFINSQKPDNSTRHQFTKTPTPKPLTQNIPNSKHPLPKRLVHLILQCHSNFRSVLAKIQGIRQVNCYCFQSFASFNMFKFKKKTCVLYHLAFLDWLPTRIFSTPNTHFLPLKTHFLTTILPHLAMFFMVVKGFVYTIVVHVYSFRLTFSSILHCVQHHFTLRLASKRTAFSTKTHCVQRHIALRFAANCSTFSRKQPQMWCKWRFLEINIHFIVFTD